MLITTIGRWWLDGNPGRKYERSARLAGPSWTEPLESALRAYAPDILNRLATATSLREVSAAFAGRVFWKRDGWWALDDRVLPPALLLQAGGDDCDGMAMLHAQAVELALGSLGWKASIVSYLARPWWKSHHFALCQAPDGRLWAIQPQWTAAQFAKYGPAVANVFGPWSLPLEAAQAIARQYEATVRWYDVRRPDYSQT